EHHAEIDCDCIIVGIFEEGAPAAAAAAVDERSQGRLAQLVASGDVSGKPGRSTLLLDLPGVKAPRVLAVGLGKADSFDAAAFVKAAGEAGRALRTGPVRVAYNTLPELPVAGRDGAWTLRQAALAADFQSYRYTATKKSNGSGGCLQRMLLAGGEDLAQAVRQAEGVAAGVALARELGNLPPNICNPQ